jgi:hypothetical protein
MLHPWGKNCRTDRAERNATFVAVATALAVLAAALPALASAARAEDRARGEIRLWAQLAGLPSSTAISADGKFVLASTADGNVSIFDINSRFGQNEVLISAPIRDEELQKQRPIAISPTGDLIALGVPLERNVADSARVYFFKRSDNKRILFTIDGLPERPLELRFLADGKRLLLVGLLANKQPPRIWDVTKIRDAALNPSTVPVSTQIVLPEPAAGFFSECKRSECHSFGLAIPPNADADIKLVVGTDSGVVFYDRKFEVAVYGYFSEGRPDLQRVSGLSFSPDGKRLAISRRGLDDTDANDSCRIHVYDMEAIRAAGPDRRLNAKPAFILSPPQHKGREVCYFSHVVWNQDAIFASGYFIAAPPADQHCRTFRDLEPDYEPFANMMLRWSAAANAEPTIHCLGTNTAVDLKPFPQGGVVTVTQDPALIVLDANGEPSRYPAQPNQLRQFEGPVFDFRDASRGELSVNTDGSIVFVRPLLVPRPYVAFDVTPTPQQDAFISNLSKEKLLDELKAHRREPIEFRVRANPPESCLGVSFSASLKDLSVTLHSVLKFRPVELIRAYQFLEPAKDGDSWRIVLGTSHRLLYAKCEGQDLWNGKEFAELAFPGTPIRNDAYQLAVSGDERFTVVAHADGILRWYRMTTGQNTLSAFLHPDQRSWVAWTAEGYFDRSDTTGGQVLGWFQSTPDGNGTWTAGLQPLAKHEEMWRKPEELEKAISDAKSDRKVEVAQQAPDNSRPLSLQIENGDNLVDPTVRISVLAGISDPDKTPSEIVVGIDGLGSVDLTQRSRLQQSRGVLMNGSFVLDRCLQERGKSYRVWVQYGRWRDHKFITWNGNDSGMKACPQRRIWGIAVGISKYDGGPSLKYAHQDAERFFEFWKDQKFYGVGRLSLLSAPVEGSIRKVLREGDKESTAVMLDAKSKTLDKFLRTEIEAIAADIKKDDILIVYFAGHGFSLPDRWYFMPSDADITDPGGTAHSMNQFAGILEAFKFPSSIPILMFIDACRSFAFGEKNTSFYNTARQDFNKVTDNFYATIFLATGRGKAAYELPEKDLMQPSDAATCEASETSQKGGGAFTHVLLSILNGKGMDQSGYIPMYEVDRYLKLDIKKICPQQEYRRLYQEELPGFFWRKLG